MGRLYGSEYGEPDGFGHRKKGSVAEALAGEIGRRTKEDCLSVI